jgi:hypothetical protein
MSEKSLRNSIIILVLICLIEAVTIGYLLSYNRKPVIPPDPQIVEIIRDSLIRDSIYIVNERIKREIVYVEEQYKKDSIDIMSASDSVLLSKFSAYIEEYNSK